MSTSAKRLGLLTLLLGYLAVLLRITVLRPGFGTHPLWSGSWNFRVFTDYLPLLSRGAWGRFVYLFFGNLAWFVPLGLLLRRGWGRSVPGCILAGFLLSLGIETGQFLFGTGVSELDDLLLNTAGTALGAALPLPPGRAGHP